MSSLLLGVAALNGVLLATGYGVLAPCLRGRAAPEWASYAGVALLVGAGVFGVLLSAAAVAGARTTPGLGLALAGVVTLAGTAVAVLAPPGWRDRVAAPVAPARASGRVGGAIATVAGAGLIGICLTVLVGGFRSSPWLDDTWFFWLPKGLIAGEIGLLPGLFTEDSPYLAVKNADYPLWWSIVLHQDMSYVGRIDMRAVNGQLALLVVSFLGAVARLLWGRVRPAILLGGLGMLAASPEFVRQAQGGGADLPLSLFLALFVIAATAWVADGAGFWLLLAGVFCATALGIKTEGLPEVAVLLAVVTFVAWRYESRRGSIRALWGMAALAAATAAPWFAWRSVHDIQNDISLVKALDPWVLAKQTERIEPAVRTLLEHLFAPQGWLPLMHIAIALCLIGFAITRRPLWLSPLLLLGAQFALLIWVYWADPLDLGYRLATSSYRVVDPMIVIAAVTVPVLGEHLARLRRSGSAGGFAQRVARRPQ